MSVALPQQVPSPDREIGPYRSKDYEALPDEPRCELIRGRFCLSPSPATLHQIVLLLLAERFSGFAEAAGGLVLVAPMDVVLAEHSVLQPDLLYLSASRCERAALAGRVEGAPDLVIEILSPATAARDRGKLELYAESGVREYWIVDPTRKSIELLVHRDALKRRCGSDGASGHFVVQGLSGGAWYHSPVLAEVRLDVADLWRRAGERAARAAVRSGGGRGGA